MADFKRSLAVVIGINEYQDYPKLQTARYDAERLAHILATKHKYDYVILVADDTYKEYRQGKELLIKNKYQPTLNGLLNLLGKRLPAEINPTKEDRLLFYFAGHGIPDDSDEGPKGYLVPLDADSKKRDSLLDMQELYKRLAALNCRHFLVILDCCFAGRLHWSSTRKGKTFPKVIHKEHYDRFIDSPAWQAITSASHDQEAFDILDDNRGTVEGTNHSPFAEGLFKALQGEADVIPAGKNGQPAGDGVITATELYLYLREHVEIGSKERQTPGLWSLPKHERGEYIFLAPGTNPKLKPAPKVNEKNNPYRGLESFDEEHSRFFFGREELIQQLSERISAPKQPLTVVLGISGSGKSSLVKAGLIPYLKKLSKSEVFEANFVSAYILTSVIVQTFPLVSLKFLPINYVYQWHILNPIRPGESPFTALAKAILALADVTDSNQPDTLNFLKVSNRLDNLTFLSEILKQKVEYLDEKVADSSFENGEESSETLRLKKEVEKFNSMAKGWHQGSQKAKQLLIVEHFEELYDLCRNPAAKQKLQQAVSDCLKPLSQRLQSDPNQLIDIVTAWSKKNPGVRLLLTIDQFEELVTLSQNNQQRQQKKQEEWQQFLNLLEKTLSANLEQLRIIVTLRSDFEPRFLNSDALKSYWTKARFPVRAMRSDELRQAIECPASEMALYFEPPNLVDKLIDEVGQMPGALPLLSFTLSELYIKLAQKWRIQETSDRALTLDADFDKQGGVAGSLTRRANQEYDNLPDDAHRVTLRRVILRMVTTEGGESARRRVPLSELVYADAAENERVKLVLERFDHARLIVSGQETGEPYVEPAHDFLVRSWDKLQKWQQEEQEDLPLQRRLTPVAIEWKSKKQSSSLLGKSEPFLDWWDKRIDFVIYLWNEINKKDIQERRRERKGQFLWNGNPYLDVLKRRLESYDHWFNQVEAEFVHKSVWRRRRNVNLRWGSAIVVTALSLVLTGWALWNKQLSDLRVEAAESRNLTSVKPIDALVLALEATRLPLSYQVFEVRSSLLSAVRTPKERDRLYLPTTFQSCKSEVETFLQNVVDRESIKNICLGNWDKLPTRLPEFNGLAFKGHEDVVTSVAFSPDGKFIVSGSRDNSLRLWDLNGNQIGEPLQGHESWVRWVAVSPDGRSVISLSNDRTIRLWDVNQENLIRIPPNEKDGSSAEIVAYDDDRVALSEDGKAIIATVRDNTLDFLWSEKTPDKRLNFKYIENAPRIKAIAITDDGEISVSVDEYRKIILWNREGEQVDSKTIAPDRTSVTTTTITPDGKSIAVAVSDYSNCPENARSDDCATITIELWDVEDKKLKQAQTLECENCKTIQAIAFSPDGNLIASGGYDNIVRLWKRNSDLSRKLEKKHTLPVESIAFSHDGKLIASGSQDNTVLLWDTKTGKQIGETLRGHKGWVSAIAFSPNDEFIATGSWDKTMRLWDIDGNPMGSPFKDHTQWISSVRFSSDGKSIISGSADRTVRWWQAGNLLDWQKKACSQLRNHPVLQDERKSLHSLCNNILSRTPSQQTTIVPTNTPTSSAPSIVQPPAQIIPSPTPPFNNRQNILSSSTPYIVQPPVQKAPSPTPPFNNRQDTPSSSAPSKVQPRPQKAPTLTPPFNNGPSSDRQALSDRKQASQLNSTVVDAHINQGLTYHRQRNYQQAISSYSKAITLNPNISKAYSNRAAAYNEQKDYQRAIADSSKAISLNPTYANAYINRGIAYYRQGNSQQAIADYHKAIELAPGNAIAYNNRALAYACLGNQQAAQADKRKAAALSQRQLR